MSGADKRVDPSDLSAEVGARLRERRNELGLSLRAVATDADVSSGHLSDIENGRSHPSLPVLIRLGRALEYPMTDLLPRIGGHRVEQHTMAGIEFGEHQLSHDQLALDASCLRLKTGDESTLTVLPNIDVLVHVVAGACDMVVDPCRYDLQVGDTADVENATDISLRATTDCTVLLVRCDKA